MKTTFLILRGKKLGFGDDEAYNIFDGPLMKRGDAAKVIIYVFGF